MKKWDYIRTVLVKVGYTTNDSLEDVVVHYLDSNAYLYFTDAGGNKFKARWDSEEPILLDSDTIVITIEPLSNMSIGETQQIQVKNEDNISVVDECTFNIPSGFEHLLSVSSTGLITALNSGSTIYVEIKHEDFDSILNPDASGTTTTFDIL
ncbi:MAG: hypothetical protein HPY57_15835 [Ignavibacteria bacterium]|nr:hypothetical protein [Ignavibacteria bacterium]